MADLGFTNEHVYLPQRYGHGICAGCGETKADGNHRDMTDEETAEARRLIDKVMNAVLFP